VFIIVAFFAAQFLAAILMYIYPLTHHWTSVQASNWLNSSIWAQFVYVLLSEGFIIGAIYLVLRRYKLSFKAIGLKKPRFSDPVYGLLALPIYFVFYIAMVAVAGSLIPSLNINEQQQIGFQGAHGGALILTFVSLVVLPPIAEEIMMRGFLYGSLREHMSKIAAALLTSVIFAAAHLPEGGSGGLLWVGFIDTFILSLVLVYLREKTGSLWASITLHALKNGVAFVALFVIHAH
jgi:membrane protease YdiL (CAAX protease family)